MAFFAYVFSESEFEYFGLDANDADERKLKRKYYKMSLDKHPDKQGGSTESFQHLPHLYEKMKRAFEAFRFM